MNEGPYLLVLPDRDYGTPVVLKAIDGGTLLVGVGGVGLVSNLPKDHKLIPLAVMTPERIEALRTLLRAQSYNTPELGQARRITQALLKDLGEQA